MKVSRHRLKEFIRTFIDYIHTVVSQYSDYELIFPPYMVYPHRIKCVVARNGVVIEFLNKADKLKIDVFHEENLSLEEYLSPKLSNENKAFFVVNGEFTRIENINLITRDFYEKFKDIVDNLFGATTIVMDKPSSFVKVNRGSIKLVNVGIAFIDNDKSVVRKIKFLWLIGTNIEDYFTKEMAELHAKLEIQRYLDALIPKIPIVMLNKSIQQFEELVYSENVKEQDIFEFLKEHPFLLRLDYELVDPKPQLSSDIIPDFIIKTHRGEYIVIELEHPKKRLFTTDEYLSEYKDLKNAKAQIEKYLDFIRNQIGCLRSKYSDISAEKIRGLLLIGLSSDLTDKEKERLKRINARLMDYEIKTYDELIESLRQFLRNLGDKYGARM